MIERLFVYGTLAPGRPNEHVLGEIEGSWEAATVTGTLRQDGWGAEMGYPGIDLDEQGDEIQGFYSVRKSSPTIGQSLMNSKARLISAC